MVSRHIPLALRVLQLSRLEVIDLVRHALQENPVLSALDEQGEPTIEALDDPDREITEPVTVRAPTLHEHLSWQARVSDLSATEKSFARQLIARVNEHGHLDLADRSDDGTARPHDAVFAQMALQSGLALAEARSVLSTLRCFDPFGVGARNRQQSLMLQARCYGHDDGEPELEIITHHLETFDEGDTSALARALDISLERATEAADTIRQLDSRPGRQFAPRMVAVAPDVCLMKYGSDLAIVDNDRDFPHFGVNEEVALRMLRDPATKELASAARRDANHLIRAIDQRKKTIVRVAEHLAQRQLAFFLNGANLEPLIVPEVAEAVGMSPSTIARVVTNKYMASPRGLVELKALFMERALSDGVPR